MKHQGRHRRHETDEKPESYEQITKRMSTPVDVAENVEQARVDEEIAFESQDEIVAVHDAIIENATLEQARDILTLFATKNPALFDEVVAEVL